MLNLNLPRDCLQFSDQAIRSLALTPVKNNQVFAGLENGIVQVWDINTGKELYTLKDPKDPTSDRILDLMFTRNSLTLYASYGRRNHSELAKTERCPF